MNFYLGRRAHLITTPMEYFQEIEFWKLDAAGSGGGSSGGNITSCPSGFTMIGDSGKKSTFCIHTDEQTATNLAGAEAACDAIDDTNLGQARLCDRDQYRKGCNSGSLTNATTNGREWTSDITAISPNRAVTVLNGSCTDYSDDAVTSSAEYRCCFD